jgi:methylenetetrahydrofolate dehydrogenase (NADP+)/methenyltetrahydrofolate cyclohydrolase
MDHYGVPVEGSDVVILGRSNIVGKPLAALLMQKTRGRNCTVTVCHSRTRDIASYTRRADIIVAAIGSPRFLKADMVREGCVVVDVGINRVKDDTAKRGYRLVGDADFEGLESAASFITPVPGGVGPLTVGMLLKNTVKTARFCGCPE